MGVVEARELKKVYASGTQALDGVSLDVDRGAVFGLLGPNGAGKTTFVRIVATQLLPTAGKATVLGYDVVRNPLEGRERIGAVPEAGRPFILQAPYEHVVTYLLPRGEDLAHARRLAKGP